MDPVPMRLALNLGYWPSTRPEQGPARAALALQLTQRAEALGYDSVWAAEAYGSDAPTVLAWLAAQTSTIGLGSAVMQIPARTPAATAMTAATLDQLSDGRFRLGLGISGPQVSEGWHGVRFTAPLGRTREYLQVVSQALAGDRVSLQGKHFQLPLPDGPGKSLGLTIAPAKDRVPIYLAASGPKNVRLAGELADGWLAIFFSPSAAPDLLAPVVAGRGERGLAGFDVVASVPVVVGDDVETCAAPLRSHYALYIGGMGSKDVNFYHQIATRLGFGEQADQIQELYLAGRHRDAAAAVPLDLIDETALLGGPARLPGRLHRFADAGVTTLALSAPMPVDTLDAVAAALTASRTV